MTPLHIRCRKGLGDNCNLVHLLKVYQRRGYDVRVDYASEMHALYAAAGIEYLPGGPTHDWPDPVFVNNPSPNSEKTNKVHYNIGFPPLPEMPKDDAWNELCEHVRLSVPVDPEHAAEARRFLDGLPPPVFLIHTTGLSYKERKDLPRKLVEELYPLLLDSGGSLVLLDRHHQSPALVHGRVRAPAQHWPGGG